MNHFIYKILNAAMQGYFWFARRADYHLNGSVIKLAGAETVNDPYPAAEILRTRGPVLRSYVNNGWIVAGYEQVTDLLRDQRVSNDFSKNKFMVRIIRLAAGGEGVLSIDYPTMLSQDPPDHTRLRKLVSQGFLHKYIQSLAPTIEHLVDELINGIKDDEHFDIMRCLAKPLPAIVIAEMLGVPTRERHQFERWSEELLGGTNFSNPALIKKSAEATTEMRAYLAELIETKRVQPGQDLITKLIEAEEDGDQLNIEELYATCILLLIAGHETTTRLIGNCMYLLLQHPEQMQLARSNDELLAGAIEESLRFEPPVQFTARTIGENFTFNGCNFKKGQLLMLLLAAANRDPCINDNPNVFDITRHKSTHVSFGYGIHLCLGMSLARLEAKIVFKKLFARFPELICAEEHLRWGVNPMFRGLDHLHVVTAKPVTLRDLEEAAATSHA